MGEEFPDSFGPEIRLDHAGETGAARIYQTFLRFSRDHDVRAFAGRHLKSEIEHLEGFSEIINSKNSKTRPSRLLFLWDAGGLLIAIFSMIGGKKWVYGAVSAVEDTVVNHYRRQLDSIEGIEVYKDIYDFITRCRNDEIIHRDEAEKLCGRVTCLLSLWKAAIDRSTRLLVLITRKF